MTCLFCKQCRKSKGFKIDTITIIKLTIELNPDKTQSKQHGQYKCIYK